MKGWGGLVLSMGPVPARQHRVVCRNKQPVGTRERGGTVRRAAVGWDEGSGQERARRRVSVERESSAESVSQVSTG